MQQIALASTKSPTATPASPVATRRPSIGNQAILRRKPQTLGTVVTDPPGAKSPYKKVSATFDGATFELTGDGKSLLSTSAQSGRPYTVDPADAAACKGATTDTYLNNPRYVGIKDNGPIPEGSYTFRHLDMVTFTALEQAKMSLASPGQYADPRGGDLHGDWGAARVALSPVKGTMVPAKYCGDVSKRSGFYLHGGVMPGSSGCIDVGNSGITSVVQLLTGYTAPVTVKVKYTAAVPSVGALGRAAGRFMYPKGKKNPSFWDRIKSGAGVDD